MNVRRPIKAVALLGIVGIFVVQHQDARYAVAGPRGSAEVGEIVQSPLAEVAELLTALRVSSVTISGNYLTAIRFYGPQSFFSIAPDEWPPLAGIASATVTAESIVAVFDRSSDPEMAEENTDLAEDVLSVVAENPMTIRRVTSLTIHGIDLASIGMIAQQDLFSTDGDGRVALIGMRSVTVSEDELVLVFDRALETESDLAGISLARIPTTCHMEVNILPLPDGGTETEVVCLGTCPAAKSCTMIIRMVSANGDGDGGRAGGGTKLYCDCR